MAERIENLEVVIKLSLSEIKILNDALGSFPAEAPSEELYKFFLELSGEES